MRRPVAIAIRQTKGRPKAPHDYPVILKLTLLF